MKKKSIEIKHPGLLHKHLGLHPDTPISTMQLMHAKNSKDPAIRKEANFALNARKFNHK